MTAARRTSGCMRQWPETSGGLPGTLPGRIRLLLLMIGWKLADGDQRMQTCRRATWAPSPPRVRAVTASSSMESCHPGAACRSCMTSTEWSNVERYVRSVHDSHPARAGSHTHLTIIRSTALPTKLRLIFASSQRSCCEDLRPWHIALITLVHLDAVVCNQIPKDCRCKPRKVC